MSAINYLNQEMNCDCTNLWLFQSIIFIIGREGEMYECRLTFVVWIGTYKTNLFYTKPN